MEEKYGFVYLWYDKKHKRYYVGCHWGFENDNYICSSTWMRNSYKRRPEDFKRRIIKRIYTSRKDLFDEEQKYLNYIKPNEVKKRYYNLKLSNGHWSIEENSLTVAEKISKSKTGIKRSEETKKKISEGKTGVKRKPFSEEHRRNLSKSTKGKSKPPRSDEHRRNLSNSIRTKNDKLSNTINK